MVAFNKRLRIILVSIPMILLIPLVAMQFASEVNWDLADFIVAGALLFTVGLLMELTFRLFANSSRRTIAILVLLLTLFLVWAELAVGIFGTPFAGS
ncbi:MAG: hypothetical protein AAGJ93_13085 [Bacteroidota bacterium]